MATLMALLLMLSLAGCSAEEKMDETVNGALEKVQSATDNKEYGSYQEILDDYSDQLAKKSKTLAKELKQEAPARYKEDGSLGKLAAEKTSILTKLYNKGVNEMSEYMIFSGDDQATFTEWKNKLREPYVEGKDLIMDAYAEALSSVS